MITLKSNREIAIMQKAGHIVACALEAVEKAIAPGVSTLELDRIAEEVIRSFGAIPSFKGYGGFAGSICASVNEVVIHGIPSKDVILKDGDIISIDVGAYYKGYHADSAKTFAVGTISEARRKLLAVTEESLYEGLKFAKPNNHLSDISHAIEQYVTSRGYGIVKNFTGHGIGQQLHEDPMVPNYGPPGRGPILKPGMTLAIEPMVVMGSGEVKILSDNWTTVTVDYTDSAHFEHSIAITDEGYIILTTKKGGEFDV